MTITEILKNWEADSQINYTDLGRESANVGKLHHKYLTYHAEEKLIFVKLDLEFKKLKLDLYEFYLNGPTTETKAKGWELPPQGRIFKGDIEMYLQGNPLIIEAQQMLGIQREKIEVIESILKNIHDRGFRIQTAITYEKFKLGA